MLTFVARRLLYAPLTFIGITFFVFVLIRAVPGDPLAYFIGQSGPGVRSPAAVQEVRERFGLDDPLLVQYGRWFAGVVRGDLGRSFLDQQPVAGKIAQKLPNTLLLNLLAFVAAVSIALPVGAIAAARAGGAFDRVANVTLLLLFSVPVFWAALLLMEFLAMRWNLLPLYGMRSDAVSGSVLADRIAHLVMPVLCLTYGQLAFFARYTRAAVEESLQEEFIRATRARGVTETALVARHAFPHALVSLISVFGLVVPYLISGSVIVERMFEWDGVGRLFLDSVMRRDYPVVMGLTIVTAVAVLVANLVADVLYAVADPRIRLEGEGR